MAVNVVMSVVFLSRFAVWFRCRSSWIFLYNFELMCLFLSQSNHISRIEGCFKCFPPTLQLCFSPLLCPFSIQSLSFVIPPAFPPSVPSHDVSPGQQVMGDDGSDDQDLRGVLSVPRHPLPCGPQSGERREGKGFDFRGFFLFFAHRFRFIYFKLFMHFLEQYFLLITYLPFYVYFF